jgi:hypothetical protein
VKFHFGPRPARRVWAVVNRQRRSLGCWSVERAARAVFTARRGRRLIVMDEYWAREYGHQMRVVVAEETHHTRTSSTIGAWRTRRRANS